MRDKPPLKSPPRLHSVGCAVIVCALAGCSLPPADFDRLMKQEGITDAKNTGASFLACKDSDDYNTGFTGIKNGQPVSGTLCGSLSAGYTIRYK